MKYLSIRTKLLAGFLAISVFAGIVAILGYYSVSRTLLILDDVVNTDSPRLIALLNIKSAAADIEIQTIRIRLIEGETKSEVSEAAKNKFELLASLEKLRGLIGAYRSRGQLTAPRLLFLDSVTASQNKLVGLALDFTKLQDEGASVSILSKKSSELALEVAELEKKVEDMLNDEIAALYATYDAATAYAKFGERNLIYFSIAAIFCAILLGFFFARLITTPILSLKNAAAEIAGGLLGKTIDVRSHDEIGVLAKSFNEMSRSLKMAYDTIAAANAKNETLIESINEGVVAIDPAGKITLINSNAIRMLGLEAGSAIGRNWFDVIIIQDEKGGVVPYEKLPMYAALRGTTTTTTTTTTYYFTRPDGSKFPIAIAAASVKNEKNEGAIVLLHDITEEKEIDRAKSEFVSLAAHQLNTPLTAMRGYTEMILDENAGKVNEKQKEYLNEVYGATLRMIQLVKSLLNVSRIELGVFSIEPEPANIVEIAEIAVGELLPQIAEKNQKFVKDLDKTIPQIPMDRTLMGMIFQNLLTNAVKYTPESGNITFTVKKDGQNALISVVDTGYGIPKEAQSKIFTKLYRADNIREKIVYGTGLGLYIIKSVIGAAGGKIWFESQENKGTSFYVTIPLSGMKKREGTRGLR